MPSATPFIHRSVARVNPYRLVKIIIGRRGSEPLIVDTKPLGVDSEPLSVDYEPSGVDTKPLSVDSEPPGVDYEPLGVDYEPLGVDSEPLGVDSEPAAPSEKILISSNNPADTHVRNIFLAKS
jgi:hypothetical protein